MFQKETAGFPEYYAEYSARAMFGDTVVPFAPVVCTGPVKYRGEAVLLRDIENDKSAAATIDIPLDHVFLTRNCSVWCRGE